MKKVFSEISTIAHLWANKVQSEARNSGNFYFDGNTIYSYGRHFPIAKHTENDKGERAVLFTERSYSNTTSKHIHVVRQSANHLNIIYCDSPDSTPKDNFNYWLRMAELTAKHLDKARKPEKYLSKIGEIKVTVERYANFFDLPIPEKLTALLNIGDKNEFAQYLTKKAEFEKQEAERAQKELKARHKKEMNKWLKGETNRLYVHNGMDYLRVKEDRIETTQAVQIPMETGRRIYEKIKSGALKVGEKVLDYAVAETGKVVKIGCHTFKTDYLLKFGQSVFK